MIKGNSILIILDIPAKNVYCREYENTTRSYCFILNNTNKSISNI